MDRSELIKALGAAFQSEDKKDDGSANGRIQVESALAGDKSVLRVTEIHENSAYFELAYTHPEHGVVQNLASELIDSGDRDMERAAAELKQKFDEAVQAKDDRRIEAIIHDAKEILVKLKSVSKSSPQRALVYMAAGDKIAKM